MFGLGRVSAQSTARAALRCDEHAFTSYARWETNGRWDGGASTDDGAARFVRSARFFTRLARQKLPLPFAASAAFLRYLATRDAFVRINARAVLRLRHLLARQPAGAAHTAFDRLLAGMRAEAAAFAAEISRARAAARAMWRRTRDPRVVSPNETILGDDAARLRTWRQWLARVRRRPTGAGDCSPLCGRWQLSFTVRNFEPALQKIVVEQQQSDGAWHELHSRFTIEFRAAAARPRTNLRRPFSLPLDNPAAPLRLGVRGLGRVGIGNIALSDGVTIRRPKPSRWQFILGHRAPAHGWPVFSLGQNADERALIFVP